ncbi:hypothetical protein FHK02_5188 [Spirosoma sp. LMG 31448]|uniref:Uncharacterized protein n=1 Tax=Spirosoma utsteinense TaxID=2585773 RepID=A0ABR6WDY1_9BACT|nr:hypothetical protein [Spirosoma utsteinense]MBC3794761.1 hypothetical protein [Spirosoma utsteinense]
MEEQSKVIDRLRELFQSHTAGALTQYQPRFWIIFWVTAVFSATLYYFTYEHLASHLSQDGRLLLLVSYLSLPLLVLRNLHLQAFILLGVSILTVLW